MGCESATAARRSASEWAVGAKSVSAIIERWIAKTDAELAVADYGIRLDADEQRRRWLILSLLSDEGLDLAAYRAKFHADALASFPELVELAPRGFATQTADRIALTADGFAHADAIGPWLASEIVRTRMAEFALS